VSTTADPQIIQTALGPFEVADSGSGPAVIVLHGTMGGWDQSANIARTIGEDGYRYLSVSRPGYLGTPLGSGRTPSAQADLCTALLDSLGIARAGVIGTSGGSPTALDLALRHPERVWGLVVVSGCAGRASTVRPPLFVRLFAQLTRWSGPTRWLRSLWARDLDRSASFLIPDAETRARTLAHPEMGPLFTEFLLATVDEMYARMKGTLNDIENMGNTDHPLEEMAVPTLIVHGTDDHMLSYADHARAFEARIPGAEMLTIEGGGHASLFTHRDRVRGAVTAFLRERAPNPGEDRPGQPETGS